MRKIIIPFLFICSMSFGQMFSAQNAESGCPDVVIGSQTWQGCNLSVTKYNDGTNIPKITNIDNLLTTTTPAYCWYNNDSATYSNPYGALYNLHAVNTGKLCPTGYRVPDSIDFVELKNYIGTSVGGKLKEIGTAHWLTPNTGAIDIYKFTGLPGGSAPTNYGIIGESGFYRSTSKYIFQLIYNDENSGMAGGTISERYGISVRCIKE